MKTSLNITKNTNSYTVSMVDTPDLDDTIEGVEVEVSLELNEDAFFKIYSLLHKVLDYRAVNGDTFSMDKGGNITGELQNK